MTTYQQPPALPAVSERERTWESRIWTIAQIALVAASAWIGTSVLAIREDVVRMQVLLQAQTKATDALERKLDVAAKDRWERQDHEAYAKEVEGRLRLLEQRLDGQSRVLQELVRKR